MSKIEKMYENAGVEKEFEKPAICVKNPYITCNGCMLYDDKNGKCNNKKEYPPFTAEKQIELIKLLQRKNSYKFSFSSTNDNSEYLFFAHKDNTPVYELIVAGDKCYEEALAGFINTLWQDLTEEECKQIKEILE